jgi:hypothetical protein|tara:strand:- start:2018 stop:2260 length:243 start_codon:yes stop_codon:yes gene_type:complete
MKGTPFKLKQKLSPKASAAKAKRDKAAAMSEWGKYKKRTAQAKGCPAGQDFDHASGKCISANANRKKNSRSGATKRKYNY